MENVRAHVYISGLVQGVFFRSNTRKQALKRGVRGWVRNLPDGRVEAIFEGSKDMVQEMVEWCKVGPPGARVSDVKVYWEEYRGEFDTFEIIY
ncbi:MAG: acylphosphatase [Nitrososphaerota archaeon]|nr:acylphosphatase [Nitrososphaerales archaeon]MCX8191538.1 acylphosphatase [Nitrososphaerales archaeon]MDW8044232.1 acylphosphatase [Nitrososphaerota archaeon]